MYGKPPEWLVKIPLRWPSIRRGARQSNIKRDVRNYTEDEEEQKIPKQVFSKPSIFNY